MTETDPIRSDQCHIFSRLVKKNPVIYFLIAFMRIHDVMVGLLHRSDRVINRLDGVLPIAGIDYIYCINYRHEDEQLDGGLNSSRHCHRLVTPR